MINSCSFCGRPVRMDARSYVHGPDLFHWECTEPPEVIDLQKVQRLVVGQNDTLVISYPIVLSSEAGKRLITGIQQVTGIERVLILDGGGAMATVLNKDSDGKPL